LFAREVLDHRPDGLFIGGSEDRLPAPFATDQVRAPKFLDVMGYGRRYNINGLGHGANRQTVFAIEATLAAAHPDLFEDSQAVLIGKGLEGLDHSIHVDRLYLALGFAHGISIVVPILLYNSIIIDASKY
jgi:hypothetical protein